MGPGQDAAAVSPVPTRFFVDGVETWSTDHAPVAPEHMRLQVKRNCPDEEQPSCGETSTTPSMYVDQVRVEKIGRQSTGTPADLVAIKEPATGGVEAHVLDPASGYAAYSNQTGLPLTEQGWRYATGDFDGDRVTDVYAALPAGGGTAQVKVLDGSDYLHSFLSHATIVQRGTRLGKAQFVAGDYDGNGRDDLWVVDLDDSGRLAVSVLDSSTGFQTELADAADGRAGPRPGAVAGHHRRLRLRRPRRPLPRRPAVRRPHRGARARRGDRASRPSWRRPSPPRPAVDPATWSVSTADHERRRPRRPGAGQPGRDDDRGARPRRGDRLLDVPPPDRTALGPTSDDTWTVGG